jgi:hypothetical protein
MQLICGRDNRGASGKQQSALNRFAASKSRFARTPKSDSLQACVLAADSAVCTRTSCILNAPNAVINSPLHLVLIIDGQDNH